MWRQRRSKVTLRYLWGTTCKRSNGSSKLICHLNTKHAVHAHKNKNYFQGMLSQNKKEECYKKLSFTVSKKALEASYLVAKLIALQKNRIIFYWRRFIKTSMAGN